eukprot:Skav220374  [mRNA]  locus=scaffold609:261412:264381:- [translate_table: standard]
MELAPGPRLLGLLGPTSMAVTGIAALDCRFAPSQLAEGTTVQQLSVSPADDWEAGVGASVEGCGMVSLPGVDPDRPKVNQDACYAVVLDGHGKKGHVVSGALKALLPDLIQEQLSTADTAAALCEAFKGTDAALRRDVGQASRASGDLGATGNRAPGRM